MKDLIASQKNISDKSARVFCSTPTKNARNNKYKKSKEKNKTSLSLLFLLFYVNNMLQNLVFCAFFLLLAEGYAAVLCIHRVNDSKRLELVAEISYYPAADLEALFDSDADTRDGSARALGDRDKTL